MQLLDYMRHYSRLPLNQLKPLFSSIFGWKTLGCMWEPILGSFIWK